MSLVASDCPIGREDLAKLRASAGSVTKRELGDRQRAERCGRNAVWHLTMPGGRRLFIKFWPSARVYARELWGLQRAMELAQRDRRFVAARLVSADPTLGAIVTEPLAGRPVSLILRQAYRVDRNPFQRRRNQQLAHRAVRAVLDWLRAFRRMPHPHSPALHDHSAPMVVSRINRALAEPCHGGSMGAVLGLNDPLPVPDFEDSSAESEALTFGDATPGNFFFDGDSLGAIDFEDIGFGSRDRDLVILRNDLNVMFAKPHYVSDPSLLDLLPSSSGRRRALVCLEIQLLQWRRAIQNGHPPSLARLRNQRLRVWSQIHECWGACPPRARPTGRHLTKGARSPLCQERGGRGA